MKDKTSRLHPQAVLTVLGAFLLAISVLGSAASDMDVPDSSNPSGSSGLQVVPARAGPNSTINSIQGASGLQQQNAQGLQRPIGEQLQPNAETSNINPTEAVQ